MDISREISKYVDPDVLKAQDPEVFDAIFEGNEYALVSEDVSGKNVLDIGANTGCFSIFSVILGANRVLSVEPNVANYSNLKSNTVRCGRITALRRAASGAPGVLFSHGEGSKATVSGEPGEAEVEAMDLGQLLAGFPEEEGEVVMKVDCEGSEYDLMMSASRRELDRVGLILMEIHRDGPMEVATLRQYLKFMGFEAEWRKPIAIFIHDENYKIIGYDETQTEIIRLRR